MVLVGVIALWALEAAADGPRVRAATVAVIDAKSGRSIFTKSANAERAIASTTKIFVAMVVRRRGVPLGGWTRIEQSDARAANGGSRTRLAIGESFRNRDLLRAMLIASDNRAPTALGRAVKLDRRGLVREMNALAKRLGLRRTRFTDPSGLRGNTSTARELAHALGIALRDPVIREILGDVEHTVRSRDGSSTIHYRSTNHALLARRYDVIGGKTGFTRAAGYCFIAAARIGGREVLMAFLGARGKQSRFADFDRVAAWLERRSKQTIEARSKRPPRGR